MDSHLIEFLILFIMIVLSAFFSASETAITSVGRVKLEEFRRDKRRGIKSLDWLKENPSMMLGTILVGNNVVNISASAMATSISISAFGMTGMGEAIGIAIGIMTFLILVFGEIVPKTVAIRNAERLALVLAPIVRVISIILYPLVKAMVLISTPFVSAFGGKMPKRGPFLTIDEIKMLLSIGEREGVIEEEEREMISSIFEFGDTIVREVMTPRPDVQSVDVSVPIEKILSVIIEGGHSRIPVTEGNIDNIIGVIYAKDLLKFQCASAEVPTLRSLLRTALFVPEGKKVHDLMHEMQAARTHIAVVVDEYGGTAGLVTMEDMVEEIVGEIYDEFEKKVKSVEKIDDNTTVMDARLSISDVSDILDIKLPSDGYDTFAGFIFGLLGKVPSVGDQVNYEDLLISVERVHKRRITRVKVVRLQKRQDEPEGVGG
jgi:putative hemolysin